MELLQAIALLCQVSIAPGSKSHLTVRELQLTCQQSLLQCVLGNKIIPSSTLGLILEEMRYSEAKLVQCILNKKI